MKRPRRGRLPAIALFGAFLTVAAACATSGGVAARAAAGGVAPSGTAASSAAAANAGPAASQTATPAAVQTEGGGPGGTSIQTAPTGTVGKVQAERRAVEEAIAFGSPSSIGRAFELLGSVAALDKTEARLLAWVAARVATIIYPLRSPSFVPQDLQNQSDIPTGALARVVSEALSGRVPDLPKESAGDPLAEILPSLALFRSDSRETARLALAALERFELLGPPSVIPALVRGLDAERRQAWKDGLASYLKAIDLATDAWPAFIGAARSQLALGLPAEALALIARVPEEIQNDSDFRKVKAMALYENASFAEAAPLVSEALREDALDSTLIIMRAHLLVRAKLWQQALPLLDAYSTVDPTGRLLILLRSQCAEGLRSREDALRWARKGLGLFPDDPEFLVQTARLLFATSGPAGEDRSLLLDEARTDARRAYELTAPEAPEPQGLSPARRSDRRDAGAVASFLLLEDAAARFDWVSAAQYVERARSAPGFASESLVALVLRRSGDWNRALDHATLWYRANPASEAAAEAYLRALIGTANIKAAEDLLPRLLLASGGTTAGRSNLHYLQSLLAKNEEAALAALRTSLVENADNVDSLLAVYDIYYRRQDWQKARFYLKQATALSPADPEIVRRSRELAAVSP